MGSTDCHMSMFDLYYKNSCGCTALEVPRGTTEQTDWRVKQQPQVACVSEDLKCWGAWCTTCWHKVKDTTYTVDYLEERGVKRGSAGQSSLRGTSSIRRTLKPFERWRWGNFSETGWSAYELFQAHRYHLELKWTENPELTDVLPLKPGLCMHVHNICRI